MKVEHTKGPWYALWSDASGNLTSIHGGAHHYAIATANSFWRGPGPIEEEAEANARLIAAAPDLLTALEAILLYEGENVSHGFDDVDAPYYTARTAIAKARGEG